MDQPQANQSVQTPTQATQIAENPVPQPVPEAPVATTKKSLNLKMLGAIGLSILLLTGIIYILSARSTDTNQPIPAATTPTPLATATPVQQPSAIATTSAFITFTENIASLSATVNAFSIQDGALSPPTLDLEIGFTRQ